jgi:hypothetical protein
MKSLIFSAVSDLFVIFEVIPSIVLSLLNISISSLLSETSALTALLVNGKSRVPRIKFEFLR